MQESGDVGDPFLRAARYAVAAARLRPFAAARESCCGAAFN